MSCEPPPRGQVAQVIDLDGVRIAEIASEQRRRALGLVRPGLGWKELSPRRERRVEISFAEIVTPIRTDVADPDAEAVIGRRGRIVEDDVLGRLAHAIHCRRTPLPRKLIDEHESPLLVPLRPLELGLPVPDKPNLVEVRLEIPEPLQPRGVGFQAEKTEPAALRDLV